MEDLINLGAIQNDPILGGSNMIAPQTLNQPLTPETVQQATAGGSMLPKRNVSQALLDIGTALLVADQEGAGSGASFYLQQQNNRRQQDRQARADQIAEYELLGRIRERQLAELQAQKKLSLAARLKQQNPDLADLIDLDPSKAAEVMAARAKPSERKIIEQGGVQYYADTGEAVLPNAPTGSGGPFEGTGMDAQVANMLLQGDPNSDQYLAAYNIASQPRVSLGPDGSLVTITPDMSAYRLPTRLQEKLNGANPQSTPQAQATNANPAGSPPAYAPSGGLSFGEPSLAKVEGLDIVEGARPSGQDAKAVKDVMGAYQSINDLLLERKRLIEGAEDFTVGSSDAEKIQQNTNQILLKIKNLEQTGALDRGSVEVIGPALGDPVNVGFQITNPISSTRRAYTKERAGKKLALEQLQSGEAFLQSTLNGQINSRGYKLNAPLPSVFSDKKGILDDAEDQQYSAQTPAQPKTQADFDALPVGTPFVNPADGKILRKK